MIYIRVPKTGSNSFIASMRHKHPYTFAGLNTGPHSEHFTALIARTKYVDSETWNTYKKIGFIRHPYNWVQSMYHLKETKAAFEQDNTLPFSEFVRKFNINMFSWFTDERGEMIIDEVYRLEDFDKIVAGYGVDPLFINETRKSPITLTGVDKKRIKDKFWKEFEYYEEKDMVKVKKRLIVEGIAYAPEDRSLTKQEVNQLLKPSKPEPESRIISIVKHGVGEITVVKEDGHRYRRYGGTLAWRNLNPGNLKYGNFAKHTDAVGPGQGNHAVYATLQEGKAAMWLLLFDDTRYSRKSIIGALSRYAPTSDGNRPKQYAHYVATEVGVSVTTRLNKLNDLQQSLMLDAMIVFEGFKVGRESLLT